MQLRNLIALVAAAVPGVLANFQGMKVPSTIVLGSPFNMTGGFSWSDKNGVPIAAWLGAFPYDAAKEPDYVPDRRRGMLGLTLPDPVNLNRLGGSYDFKLDFVIPKGHFSSSTFYLQWFQIIQYGAYNEVQAESYLMGPLKTGTQVSTELVTAVVKRFPIEDCKSTK